MAEMVSDVGCSGFVYQSSKGFDARFEKFKSSNLFIKRCKGQTVLECNGISFPAR